MQHRQQQQLLKCCRFLLPHHHFPLFPLSVLPHEQRGLSSLTPLRPIPSAGHRPGKLFPLVLSWRGQSFLLMVRGWSLCSGVRPFSMIKDAGVIFMPFLTVCVSPQRRRHICPAVRSQAGPECLQIELGCRSLLTWQEPSPREGTGCFMGSRSCSAKKKKSPLARQRLDSGWRSFQKGGAKRAAFNAA